MSLGMRTPHDPLLCLAVHGVRTHPGPSLLTVDGADRRPGPPDEYVVCPAGPPAVTQPPQEGQWDGGRITDTYDDFAARYAFAFWRLAVQGVTSFAAPREPGEGSPPNRPGAQLADPDVRVIRLTKQVPAQPSA